MLKIYILRDKKYDFYSSLIFSCFQIIWQETIKNRCRYMLHIRLLIIMWNLIQQLIVIAKIQKRSCFWLWNTSFETHFFDLNNFREELFAKDNPPFYRCLLKVESEFSENDFQFLSHYGKYSYTSAARHLLLRKKLIAMIVTLPIADRRTSWFDYRSEAIRTTENICELSEI